MGFGTQHQTSGKLLQHFIPTMSMRLVLYSEAMQYCHQKRCLTWKFITQGLILGIKQKGKVRQALCCILIYQGLHTHTHIHTSASASVLFEKGPVGFSSHVDSSLCETESKHLLCVASTPRHTCFLRPLRPSALQWLVNLLNFCSSHMASGLRAGKKKHLSHGDAG